MWKFIEFKLDLLNPCISPGTSPPAAGWTQVRRNEYCSQEIIFVVQRVNTSENYLNVSFIEQKKEDNAF